METNRIVEEIRAVATTFDWRPKKKEFYEQRAADVRPVQCVRMQDAFSEGELYIIFDQLRYRAQKNMCYKNAVELVRIIQNIGTVPPVKYVEGFYHNGLMPFEHAFVKVGDKYIDPTFERALHLDVRKEMYAVLIELDPETMAKYLLETGYYGEFYLYDYLCKHRPELAAKMREHNPYNR